MEPTPESGKYSFILYENKETPKYFEIKKSFLRFLVFGLPLITLVSLAVIVVGTIYFKQIKEMAERKEPKIIRDLKALNLELTKRENELSILNGQLESKLASGASASASGLSSLSIFKSSPGQEDLTQNPVFNIQDTEFYTIDNTVNFKFKIFNVTKDSSKRAGYVFVLMKTKTAINIYPQDKIDSNEVLLSFNQGLYIATSRFRPVQGSFTIPKGAKDALFKILIFSRTGDLVHKKTISQELTQ